MIIATIIYFLCIFALTLHYQRKIKKLHKHIDYLSDVRKLISDKRDSKLTSYKLASVDHTFLTGYYCYDFFGGTERGIRRFAEEMTMEYLRLSKDNYERLIYGALFDKLVTDDRTEEDNRKTIKVELRIPYIQMNEKSIEATIYE